MVIHKPHVGGTFIYCPFFLRLKEDPPMYCARFRRMSAYRRHWRRFHAAV